MHPQARSGGFERQARATLAQEGVEGDRCTLLFAADLRYKGQQSEITVSFSESSQQLFDLRSTFEELHHRQFDHTQEQGIIEVVKLRVAGIGKLEPVAKESFELVAQEAKPSAYRKVWVDSTHGWMNLPILDGAPLHAGHWFDGPAIVNEQTTTILVGGRDRASVDPSGNLVIEVNSRSAA